MSDSVVQYEVLVIPADIHVLPHIKSLITATLVIDDVDSDSTRQVEVYRAGRIPYPELLMEYTAPDLGPRSWRYQVSYVLYLSGSTSFSNQPRDDQLVAD